MVEKWGSGGPGGAGTGPAAPPPGGLPRTPPPQLRAPQTPSAPPPPAPARPALGDGMKLAAAVMSPRGAEEAEGPPGSPARLV